MITFNQAKEIAHREAKYYSSVLLDSKREEFLNKVENVTTPEELFDMMHDCAILYSIKNNLSYHCKNDYIWPESLAEYYIETMKTK